MLKSLTGLKWWSTHPALSIPSPQGALLGWLQWLRAWEWAALVFILSFLRAHTWAVVVVEAGQLQHPLFADMAGYTFPSELHCYLTLSVCNLSSYPHQLSPDLIWVFFQHKEKMKHKYTTGLLAKWLLVQVRVWLQVDQPGGLKLFETFLHSSQPSVHFLCQAHSRGLINTFWWICSVHICLGDFLVRKTDYAQEWFIIIIITKSY